MHGSLKYSFVLIALLVGACALSPQTIQIKPGVELQERGNIGQGRALSVQVRDNRDSPVVGTRGGVYASTSEIRTAADIGTPIRHELADRLRVLGFRIVDAGQQADADLTIMVDAISYEATGEPVVRSVETAATVRVRAGIGNREYSGRYRASRTTKVLKAPGVEDNEEMINAAVSRVLERLLADRELLDFLRG